ncbi:Uncharacterized protein SCF082_LOCUS32313 [Durusdinium trenchii]|uniref:Uncharacterized protein n=1 Tax=Durusdinium trenchii TaxID=1381693 RepID=A0ABP0NF96_9DINO
MARRGCHGIGCCGLHVRSKHLVIHVRRKESSCPRNKKQEIASLRRELAGERLVPLNRLAGDSGTDDGERRHQLVWQNFRIKDCTSANAMVLGTEHPEFIEGQEAAAANTVDLFDSMELYPAGVVGVPLERLATVHGHYFGSGFEKTVGRQLRDMWELFFMD